MVKIKEIVDIVSQEETLNITTTLKGIIWDPYVVMRTILIFAITILVLLILSSIITSIRKVTKSISADVQKMSFEKKTLKKQ